MSTIFSYNKDAYAFTQNQKKVLLKLIDFIKYYIPEGNYSYLDMLDLDKIEFTWCPKMALPISDTVGAWFLFYPNKVFIQPGQTNKQLYNLALEIQKTTSDQELKEYCKSHIIERRQSVERSIEKSYIRCPFDTKQKNQMIIFIDYLIQGGSITPLATIFHQMYHKWQFNNSFYIPYLANFFVQLLFGYQLSTKLNFFIEGDVRKYIDKKELHDGISQFSSIYNHYVYLLSTLRKYEAKQQKQSIKAIKKQINQFKKDTNRTNKFLVELFDFINENC